METKVTIATVEVNEAGLTGLRAKTDKLNKRAERHGMNKLTVTVVRKFRVEDEDTGLEEDRYCVEINGTAPCINGWWLAARVEFNDIIGQVVHVVPGKFADCDYSAYRNHDGGCDHCNTRRRRNDVFVLANESGEFKVVGRNCLADYLRCEDAEAFARYAEFCEAAANWSNDDCADEAYGDGFGGRGGQPVAPLDTFLTAVSTCTRRMGWVSRTAARDSYDQTATADHAYYLLYGRKDQYWRDFVRRNDLHTNDKDKENAAKAIQWAQSLSDEKVAKSEYLATIRKIAQAEATDAGLAGYAASIIRAYQKDCEWEAERAEKAANAPRKDYVGEKGKRFRDLVVTIKRIRYYENDWGVKTIVAMEAQLSDDTIAPITWFASGEHDYDEGDVYKLTATVKDHEDNDRFGKQTIVQRAKLEPAA